MNTYAENHEDNKQPNKKPISSLSEFLAPDAEFYTEFLKSFELPDTIVLK